MRVKHVNTEYTIKNCLKSKAAANTLILSKNKINLITNLILTHMTDGSLVQFYEGDCFSV